MSTMYAAIAFKWIVDTAVVLTIGIHMASIVVRSAIWAYTQVQQAWATRHDA